jgi:hypothetical protein
MRRIYDGLIGGETLSVCAYHAEMEDRVIPRSSSFLVDGPSLSTRSGGVISGIGCVVPHPLAIGGNWPYLGLSVITGDPRYPGSITPIVAPEPSIELVAGGIHSTGSKIVLIYYCGYHCRIRW